MSDDHSPRPQTAHPLDPADVQAISDWLVEQGLYTAGFETLFAGFCERLVAAGVPLWRGQVAMRTLHPTVDAIAYRWRPASGVESASLLYSDSESEAWLQSPFHHMLASGTRTLRHRLDGEPTALPFPILDEFRGGAPPTITRASSDTVSSRKRTPAAASSRRGRRTSPAGSANTILPPSTGCCPASPCRSNPP
jgi:hypothetical protein